MKPLSSQTRRVLELARLEEGPDAAAASRMERSLAKRIALGGALVGGATLTKSAAAAGLWATLGNSAVVVGAVAGIAFAGWEAAQSPSEALEPLPIGSAGAVARPAAQTARRKAPTLNSPVPESEMLAAPDRPWSAKTAPESAAPASNRGAASRSEPERRTVRKPHLVPAEAPQIHSERQPSIGGPPPLKQPAPTTRELDQLALETQELREAQQALRNGDSLRALGLLEQQEHRHAAGVLVQERHAARVLALCQSGQVQRARVAAERFERRFPRSALLGRVRNACSE